MVLPDRGQLNSLVPAIIPCTSGRCSGMVPDSTTARTPNFFSPATAAGKPASRNVDRTSLFCM